VKIPIGVYEKALPSNIDWLERLSLAGELGFDFVELSIDESEGRLARLEWDSSQRNKLRKAMQDSEIPVLDICLSAHRQWAMGSSDAGIRDKAMEIMHKAIDFAVDVGVRIIQLAGYYVFYEPEDELSKSRYKLCLEEGLKHAEKAGVMLALENVDGTHVNSITRVMEFVDAFNSPWFQAYPDIGNLTEQGLDVSKELSLGNGHFVAVHVKDVRKGQVRRIPFGEGIVDFDNAFKTLKQMEFSGPFLIEMWNDDSLSWKQIVTDSLDFIRTKMKIAGLE
jgi:L-ribulose-5-phosphate 3-epimerase